jgi:hypothetical protein
MLPNSGITARTSWSFSLFFLSTWHNPSTYHSQETMMNMTEYDRSVLQAGYLYVLLHVLVQEMETFPIACCSQTKWLCVTRICKQDKLRYMNNQHPSQSNPTSSYLVHCGLGLVYQSIFSLSFSLFEQWLNLHRNSRNPIAIGSCMISQWHFLLQPLMWPPYLPSGNQVTQAVIIIT